MSAMAGQGVQESEFRSAIAGGRMAHAWLLTGPRGVGKASFAGRAATWLLAHGGRDIAADNSLDVDADHPAQHLIDSGAHPEFLWLKRDVAPSKKKIAEAEAAEEDLARNITVEQVRGLIGRMRTKPAISEYRAVVIDSIDDLERGAANALLKTLEEPPANTIFFLVSHNPGRLLPTIRSRCRTLRFAPLDSDMMASLLFAARPDLDSLSLAALVRMGEGSPGKALAYAALDGIADTEKTLRTIASGGDRDNRLRAELARQFGTAAAKPRFDVMLAQAVGIAAEAAHQGREGALAVRDRLLAVAGPALRNSEDLSTVAFAIGNGLAELAATGKTVGSPARQ